MAKGMVSVLLVAGLAISGCARTSEPRLLNLRDSGAGPDEFTILPVAPLVIPDEVASLPPPTPGAPNRADPAPLADAVLALGGTPAAAQQPRAGEAALLAQATRYGIDPAVRDVVAAEDLAFRQRRRGRPLERLFKVNTYFDAYRRQELDQYDALERYRRAGVPTAAAPPDPELR